MISLSLPSLSVMMSHSPVHESLRVPPWYTRNTYLNSAAKPTDRKSVV